MKKQITLFLMLAITIVGIGSLSSCKDYDEDQYNQLKLENMSLNEYYKKLQGDIEKLLPLLQIDHSQFVTKPEINDMATKTWVLEQIAKIQPGHTDQQIIDIVKEAIKDLKNCDCTIKTTEAVQALIDAAIGKLEIPTKDIVEGWIATYVSENYYDKTKVDQLIADAVNNLVTQQQLQDAIDAIKQCSCDKEVTLHEQTFTIAEAIAHVDALVHQLNTQVGANTEAISRLNEDLGKIKEDLAAVENKATDAYNKAVAVGIIANDNATKITNITTIVSNLKEKLDGMYTNEEIDNMFKNLDNLYDKLGAAAEALETAKAYTDEAKELLEKEIKAVDDKVDALSTTVEDYVKELKAADEKMQEDIADLTERVEKLEKEVKEIKELIEKLQDDVEDLLDARAKQITGITIQQVYNPAIGTLSLPADISTNILVAYYGEAVTKDVMFPNYAWHGVAREKLLVNAGQGEVLVDGAEEKDYATAGRVYVTINPTDVDFDGVQGFRLVNSQDVESSIKLGEAKASDEVLKFGYTRAASNGFYEIPAIVSKDDVKNANKLHVDKSEVKKALTDLIKLAKERDKNDVIPAAREIATVIYKTAHDNFNLDAQGIEVAWKDSFGTHSVISEYKIASTAVRPLGFESFEPITHKQIGTSSAYSKMKKLINKLNDKVNSFIHRGFDKFFSDSFYDRLDTLQIKGVEYKGLSEDLLGKFVVKVNQEVDLRGRALEYYINENEVLDIAYVDNIDDLTYDKTTIIVCDGKAYIYVNVVNKGTNEPYTKDGKPLFITIPTSYVTVAGNEATLPNGNVMSLTKGKVESTGITIGELNITVIPEGDNYIVNVPVEVDFRDQIREIWGDVDDIMANYNKMAKDIQDIVVDANKYIDDLTKYEDSAKRASNKVFDYLRKILNKGVNVADRILRNADMLLKPAVLISSDKGTNLAGFRGAEPRHSGSITLWATTYTGEMLAPCLAKFVTVNGKKMEILDRAGKIEVPADALVSGRNEIKYSAIDYNGYVPVNEDDMTFYFWYE